MLKEIYLYETNRKLNYIVILNHYGILINFFFVLPTHNKFPIIKQLILIEILFSLSLYIIYQRNYKN